MATDTKRTKKIGRLGELLLHRLATEAGLTVSKPEDDENGWDRILEFPVNRCPNVFLDGQPSALKCLVQVKTSDKKLPKVDMELSNFEHLAKTPMPAFMLFVYFGGGDEPVSAHFSHFSAAWIGKTLERIRTLEAKGSLELHKHTMVFAATDSEKLAELNGRALVAAIVLNAGIDADSYALKKVEVLKTIGFGPEKGVARLNIRATREQMSRALVGLTSVNVENGEIYQRRFGIDLKERDLQTGTLSIKPSVAGRCTITASGADLSRPVRVDADVILPSARDLPPELMLSLVQNDNIQIEIQNDEGRLSCSLNDDKEYELSDTISNIELMLLLARSGTEITFTKDGFDFGTTLMERDLDVPDTYPQLLRTLKIVRDLLELAQVPRPHHITLDQLRDQMEEIYWADMIIRKENLTISSKFDSGRSDIQTREGSFSRPVIIKCRNKHHFMMFFWDATIVIGAKKVKAKISNSQHWDTRTILDCDNTQTIEAALKRFEAVGRKRRGDTLMSVNLTFVQK